MVFEIKFLPEDSSEDDFWRVNREAFEGSLGVGSLVLFTRDDQDLAAGPRRQGFQPGSSRALDHLAKGFRRRVATLGGVHLEVTEQPSDTKRLGRGGQRRGQLELPLLLRFLVLNNVLPGVCA